jgi:hypothetical protein
MRKLGILTAVLTALIITAGAALAGSAHYPGNPSRNPSVSIDGNTLTASGKVAGLGNIDQIEVTVTADAECINPGGNKPQAANKETFSATSLEPVQNGKADFSIMLTATFQPDCTPPMTLVWSNVTISVAGFPELTRTFL